MAERPINPDREQQRRDNLVSRRQSGLEPRPEDLEHERAAETDEPKDAASDGVDQEHGVNDQHD